MSLNVLRRSRLLVGLCALTLLLSSCDGETPEANTTPETTPAVQGEPLTTPPEAGSEPTTSKTGLEAGSYCYRAEGETLQAIAEILVEPNQTVSGTLEATITDDANGYYTSYDQSFAGVLEGDTFNASITTNIENDVQKSQETWTLNQNLFSDGDNVSLKRTDCEEIISLKNGDKGTETPPAESTPSPAPESTAPPEETPAVSTSPIRVQFPQGSTETTLSGQLNTNQTQVYLVKAQEGQDMYIEIERKSGKPTFDVEVDNGEVIEQQLGEYLDFTLPFSGDYIITVSPGSSAASYELLIRVQ